MKKCFKCGIEKPLSEFYRHRMMADGHLSKCADCTRKDVAEARRNKIEAVREYDRQRSGQPHRKALRERVSAQWKRDNPERARAVQAANNAVRNRQIERPDVCEGCGGTDRPVQKHHPDYSKPLLVVWFCKPCHAIADKIRRRLEAS